MKNCPCVLELSEAIQLHKSLAIIKVPGHSMANMEESKCNHLADIAADKAALKHSQPLMGAPVVLAEAIGDLKATLWKRSI